MQPQKVSRNMRMPTIISRMAGSTARQATAASGGVAASLFALVPTERGTPRTVLLPWWGTLLVWTLPGVAR